MKAGRASGRRGLYRVASSAPGTSTTNSRTTEEDRPRRSPQHLEEKKVNTDIEMTVRETLAEYGETRAYVADRALEALASMVEVRIHLKAEVERLRAIRDLADKACLAYGRSKGRVIPELERLGQALEEE